MKCCCAFALAAIVFLYAGPARATAPAAPPDWNAAMRAQTLTAAEDALDGYFFAGKNTAIRAALEAHRGALLAIKDPEKFENAVTGVLYSVAHDKHLRLLYSPDALPPLKNGKPSPAQIADMRREDRFMDYGYSSSARLPGNIGYLRLAFFPALQGSKPMYDSAMSLLGGTDALIIDLRGNGGGDPEAVNYLIGYFFARPVEVTGFLWRAHGKIKSQRMFTPVNIAGARYVVKPVLILTNYMTISGGEQFVYDMKSLHRAKVIGAATAGGANIGGPVRLNDHFGIFIPRGTARNPYTGTNWEGAGVSPDVAIDPKKALLRAYELALRSVNDPYTPAVEDRAMALKDPVTALNIALPQH